MPYHTHRLEVKESEGAAVMPSHTHRLEVKSVSSASREVMQSTIRPGMISGGSIMLSQEVATRSTHGSSVCHKKNTVRRRSCTRTSTF